MPQCLVDPKERSHSLVESDSIVSIFPPYSSDTESESNSASNESPPRVSYSIVSIFWPYSSDTESESSSEFNESPARFSLSIESRETLFPPWRSPNHSDSFENFEEISTSSTRTLPTQLKQKVVIKIAFGNGEKGMRKAMKSVAGERGVESLTLKFEGNGQIEVFGDGIDLFNLIRLLRKKFGCAELINISTISTNGEQQQQQRQHIEIGIQSMGRSTYPADVSYLSKSWLNNLIHHFVPSYF